MSLKIIKIKPKIARVVIIGAAILTIASAWFFMRWQFADSIASHFDRDQPESKIVAEWLAQIAPSDPLTHYAAAVVYERTFDPSDLERSLNEYELSAALSPNNYQTWLNLAKARNTGGDSSGAEAAYRRALELAPNYSAVQWAYGNFLVRQGRPADGFAMIAKAAGSDPQYSSPATTIALEIFDGDPSKVRSAMGDDAVVNAALASALSQQGRFDEAVDSWAKLPQEDRLRTYSTLGQHLIDQMSVAKKFQLAARVSADMQTDEGLRPVIGQVTNGGFESGVKLRQAGMFDWAIADGSEPQVGLSETQKRSGKYGLSMIFNTFDSADFRSISQIVPVIPGTKYELELFYRSDLNTKAALKWEVANAATTAVIASTDPLAPAGDWTSARVQFTAPTDSDGIIIRLARDGCSGPACQMTGRLSFDDISLKHL